jgi:hypothetical protein
VDLPGFVVAFLRKHRKEQSERKMAYRDVWSEHDIVFDDGIGQPMSPWTVSADFRRILGHSSTSFTMDTYSAVIPSMGRAAADAADQLFGEQGGR